MRKRHEISVEKASGEMVPYKESKLIRSLIRSGATDEEIDKIITFIRKDLHDGITTKEIYDQAFSLLKKESRPSAARYNLKRAIYDFGPTGFPFEKFVGAILSHEGFDTKVSVIVQGNCIKHEVDVVAEKGDRHYMVECKFHHERGISCDVKVPLYIQSRFLDVKGHWLKQKGHEEKFHQGWIVTNTRFTADAIQYGKCSGLELIGWNYPRSGSLNERIDRSGLHPLTSLTTLTRHEKQELLKSGYVLCIEICEHPKILKDIHLSDNRIENVLKEARSLCNYTEAN